MSRPARPLPEEQQKALRRARWIETIWMFVLGTIVTAIYFSLGNSQAMKTAWIEDMLSFVPPLAFLIASWVESWAPSSRFPLGFIRVTSIAYLMSAVALGGVGIFLIVDSAMALIKTEHPTIGSVELFGATVWFGWVMIAALIYSVVLPVIFGRLKMKPARLLHDKTLWADALMNKADENGGEKVGHGSGRATERRTALLPASRSDGVAAEPLSRSHRVTRWARDLHRDRCLWVRRPVVW